MTCRLFLEGKLAFARVCINKEVLQGLVNGPLSLSVSVFCFCFVKTHDSDIATFLRKANGNVSMSEVFQHYYDDDKVSE